MVYADTNSEMLKKKKKPKVWHKAWTSIQGQFEASLCYMRLCFKNTNPKQNNLPSKKYHMTIKRSSSWTSARFQTAGGIKSCSRTGELNYFGDFLTASCWIPLFTNSYVTCMHLCVQGLSGSGIYLLMSKNLNSKDTPSVHALTQSSPHFSSGVYMEA